MSTLLSQCRVFFSHYFRQEYSSAEKFLTPILFSLTVILLCNFAFAGLPDEARLKMLFAQSLLTTFLALQLSFARIFQADLEDAAFELLRVSIQRSETIYLGKFFVVFIFAAFVFACNLGLSSFFLQGLVKKPLSWEIFLAGSLAVIAMVAIGVLLSGMLAKAHSSEIIFPLIYFPLTAPILIATLESFNAIYFDGTSWMDLLRSWQGFVLILDVLFFSLGFVLFPELLKGD